MATKMDSLEWWQLQLTDVHLHDNIQFNAIGAFKSMKLRKGLNNTDLVLDNLIQLALIDREKEVSYAITPFSNISP